MQAEFKPRQLGKRVRGVYVLAFEVVMAACRRLPGFEREIVHVFGAAPLVNKAVLGFFVPGILLCELHLPPVVVSYVDKMVGLQLAVKIVLFVKAFYILSVKEYERAFSPSVRALVLRVLARHVLGEQYRFLRNAVEDENVGVFIARRILFAQRAHGAQHGIIYRKGDDRDDDERGIHRHPHI